MIDLDALKSTLSRPRVLLSIAAAVVIVLIWAFAYFLPQGTKISQLKAQETTLQKKVQTGNATVARLKHTFQHSAQLQTMENKLYSSVPSNADAYDYVQSLSTAATSSGVHLTTISIAPSPGGAATGSGPGVHETPVNMSVKGTYDQVLSLISKIYLLPRLTDIEQLNINGGGSKSTRSTELNASFQLIAFSSSSSAPQAKA